MMSASASTWGVSIITVTTNTHCLLSSSIMAVMWLPKRTSTLSMSSAFAAWLSRRTRRVISQFNTRVNSFPRFVNGYLNFNWEELGKGFFRCRLDHFGTKGGRNTFSFYNNINVSLPLHTLRDEATRTYFWRYHDIIEVRVYFFGFRAASGQWLSPFLTPGGPILWIDSATSRLST